MKGKSAVQSKLIFLGLVVLAFSLRSVYFSQTVKFIQPGIGSDSSFYLQWARDIVLGNVLGREVFYALPLYPYFLSLAYLFSGGEIYGIILIQMLIGAISCGLIYLLGKRLFNIPVGVIASLIACGYFMLIFYDRILLPTSLGIFLGLLLMLLLLRAKVKPCFTIWFGVGFLLGLCTLAAGAFSLLAPFILLWLIYEYKHRALGKLILYCASFILAFSLIVGGVFLRNYLVAGDYVFTAHSGINFYIGNNRQANGLFTPPHNMRPTQSGLIEDARIFAERVRGKRLRASEVSDFWRSKAKRFIKSKPKDYFKLLRKKLVLFYNGAEHIDEIAYFIYNEEAPFSKLPLFKFSFVLPLAILGMVLSWPQRKKIFFLYIFIIPLTLATVLFFINSRYRMNVIPFFIILAAAALWQIIQGLKNRQYIYSVISLILFLPLYFFTNVKVTDGSKQLNFTLHYNKGVIFSAQRDYPKAKQELQAALKMNPLDFMSYLALGNVDYEMKNLQEAVKNYKEALAINPYFYKAHFNLGVVYDELGRKEEAEREFKEVLKFNPEDCGARYNLGRIYQEKGLQDLALKEYQKALEIKPKNREILQAIEEVEDEIASSLRSSQ